MPWKPIKKVLVVTALGALACATSIPLAAQSMPTTPTTPTTASTCTTAPTTLSALNFERQLTLTDLLTTLTPNLPANELASITGGAQEIREILIYNPQQGTVTSTVFLVAAGAPLPTPNFNFQTGVIQTTTLKISQILTSCSPTPSLLIVGTLSNSSATGAFGNLNGAPAAISLGYTTATPPVINNVVEVVAGSVIAYSAAGTGTLTFPATAVVPPGSNGNITILVTNPQLGTLTGGTTVVQVAQNPLLLDASKSTATGPLTFTWSALGQPVNFVGTGTPGQILVTFPNGGDYTIMVTATDTATGATVTFGQTFQFIGANGGG